jgi:N-acetylglucosamine-6-phosphate deacetylase
MVAREVESGRTVEVAEGGGRVAVRPASTGHGPTNTWIGRGWFDVQVNGFAGHDVNAGGLDVPGFEGMTRALHAKGVARYLPTVITASPEHLRACLSAVPTATASSETVARAVAGVHLEGPFLSPVDGARGAHPVAHVRPADRALFDDLQSAAGGAIRLVTLAPEVPGAIDLVAYLVAHGVEVALGHTMADGAAVREAVAAGARLSTHLGNGAPALLPRHPNVIWEQLADDRLMASAIFDGHHLPESVMRVWVRVKGPDRLVLTSDAVALAGMPPGTYEAAVGGRVHLAPSGRLTVAGTPYLAGSASSLLDGVRTAIAATDATLRDAFTMAARTPRALLGRDDPDDWTLVRDDGPDGLEVIAVIVDGRVVHGSLDA